MALKKTTKYDDVYDVSDFAEFHNREYSHRALGLKGSGRRRAPLWLIKKIILTYFDIYLKELYYGNKPMYFLFSGFLQVVRTAPTYKANTKKPLNESLALFWGDRCTRSLAYFAEIIKLTGKTNRLPVIEKTILKNNDIAKFPKFDKTIKDKRWLAD